MYKKKLDENHLSKRVHLDENLKPVRACTIH